MKTVAAVVVLAGLAAVVQCARLARQSAYTTQYDGVDLPSILNNDRLRKNYIDCLLDRSPRCSPDAKTLKGSIPDALKDDCAKCSEKQKSGTKTVLEFLRSKKPDELKLLTDKYDPDGVYQRRYAHILKL